MDNLRKSIEIIFVRNCPDKVLQNDQSLIKKSDGLITQDYFNAIGINHIKNYNSNEIDNLFLKLEQDWFFDPYKQGQKKKSIFNILTHFNKHTLEEINRQPFIKYEHLLRWRHLSYILGEDLFTCSYLAYMDNRSARIRSYFSWRSVIFSNNNRLKKLLEQGISENHFHLKGSGPVFELSWMALMNHPSNIIPHFKNIEVQFKLDGDISYSLQEKNKELDILVCKASYIRHILFKNLILNEELNFKEININLNQNSNRLDSNELLINLRRVQDDIYATKELYSYRFLHKNEPEFADYAILKNIQEDNFDGSILLSGERKFLYEAFRKIYTEKEDNSYFSRLFYSYLLIKSRFRAELVQINTKVGFGNFLAYQNRKEVFIPENSIYETAFLSMAVNDSRKFQNIQSFELRIAPKESATKLHKSLLKNQVLLSKNVIAPFEYLNDTNSPNFQLENYFYTIHFIKVKDNQNHHKLSSYINCRDKDLREIVKTQARAIVSLRESYSSKAKLINGIDAASSEFDARPEVFAVAFRYLKDHKLKGEFNVLKNKTNIVDNKLFATYHAGEDFFDIVDGLRTIDEAIKFLNLRQGDRIGHALALGLNANDYFKFKGGKLLIPKGVLLDNIAWILAQIRKFNINDFHSESNRLNKIFETLFYEIYKDQNPSLKGFECTSNTYYDAWKLRGDDPELFKGDITQDIEAISGMSYWERCRLNHFYPKKTSIRKNVLVKKLYQEYHFNPIIKQRYSEIKQFEITPEYLKIVTKIQKEMQNILMLLNIGIECNPTSNYLIGTFKRYDKHPIIDFYNLGLESDSDKIESCPQLFVSINTDDQGIFGTSLENEFALMAIALEKAKDENGTLKYKPSMIYQWLDNIRKMGNEQSFKST